MAVYIKTDLHLVLDIVFEDVLSDVLFDGLILCIKVVSGAGALCGAVRFLE